MDDWNKWGLGWIESEILRTFRTCKIAMKNSKIASANSWLNQGLKIKGYKFQFSEWHHMLLHRLHNSANCWHLHNSAKIIWELLATCYQSWSNTPQEQYEERAGNTQNKKKRNFPNMYSPDSTAKAEHRYKIWRRNCGMTSTGVVQGENPIKVMQPLYRQFRT